MNIPDQKINLYAINPSLLTQDEQTRIESLIASDEQVKKYVDELRELHLKLLEIFTGRPEGDAASPDLYVLKPLGPPVSTDRMKLAAESAPAVRDESRLINSYISADEYIMINLHYNPVKEEYTLFLICDDMEKVKNAKVRIEGIDDEFFADSDGVLKITGYHIAAEQKITVKTKQ
jgi:hypothetical protein